MQRIAEENTMRGMMTSHYGDEKLSKQQELNSNMTIQESQADEYEQTLHNLGGRG